MDMVSLQDRISGRSAVIRRPRAEYVDAGDLPGLEVLVRRWFSVLREEETEATFVQLGGERPDRLLYGLYWLAGLWCSLHAARKGVPVEEKIAALDYFGLRRGPDDGNWTILTQVVRRGVSNVANDSEVAEYFQALPRFDPSMGHVRRHLLTILDGLTQDMEGDDLAPWGAAEHILTATGWLGRQG